MFTIKNLRVFFFFVWNFKPGSLAFCTNRLTNTTYMSSFATKQEKYILFWYLSGRPRRRWEDNIRMDLEEIGINTRNWVDSAQDRNYWRTLVNVVLNLRVP